MKAFFVRLGKGLRSFFGRFSRRTYELIAIILLCAVLIFDLGFHFFSSLSGGVETLPAKKSALSEKITADAFLVFEEESLSDQKGQFVSYRKEGEKVAEGSVLGALYGEDAPVDQINALAARYRVKRLLQEWETMRPDKIDETIRLQIAGAELAVDQAMAEGNLRFAAAGSAELEALLLCREKLNGSLKPEEALKKVEGEIELLESFLGEPKEILKSPGIGWFSSFSDDYTGQVGMSSLETMTYGELAGLLDTLPRESTGSGRFLSGYRWYAVAFVDRTEASFLSAGRSYPAELQGRSFTLTLERVVFEAEGGSAALVFSCGSLTDALSLDRCSKMELVVEEHQGFKIPASAVTYNEGVQGVYILRGFVVEFREVAVIYREDAMLIADPSPKESSDKFRQLAENDNIIVKGEDLYVGKIIQ